MLYNQAVRFFSGFEQSLALVPVTGLFALRTERRRRKKNSKQKQFNDLQKIHLEYRMIPK